MSPLAKSWQTTVPLLPYLLVALLAFAAIVAPFDRRLAMEIMIVLAMAQGWNLLCGYTGLLSFGHHAFIGLGAYVLYVTVNTTGVSPFPIVVLSAVAATFVAFVMWLLLRHLRGPYFSIGIWVLADSLRLLFAQWDLVGSSRGIVLNAMTINPATFADTLFFCALGLACLTLAGTFALLRSRIGLALMAIRDNESGAASVGIALMPVHGDELWKLVSVADQAMYNAKAMRKGDAANDRAAYVEAAIAS